MRFTSSFLALAAVALGPAQALWPVPKELETGSHVGYIQPDLLVTYNGDQLDYVKGFTPPSGSDFASYEVVKSGVSRALDAIFEQGLVPWMLRARGSDFEPAASSASNSTIIKTLEIVQTKEDTVNTFKPVIGSVDESYTLKVSLTGKATIKASSSTGVLRALETFTQLFYAHSSGDAFYTKMLPVSIKDKPEFDHRGVHLDVSRHWFEIDDIKRAIDGAAMNKMNVFHLHITDTQSWPLEIPALPKLTEKHAHAPGLTYSPEDIAGLYEYAIYRGVQILMEIDMPGHIGIELAYPGLSIAYNEKPYTWYCAQPPCGSFKLNNTDVEDFLTTLLDDLLPRIAPYTSYFHTGGDEYKANNSLLDPALETNDVTILQPMLQRFLDHVHGEVEKHGLRPLVWEEMVLEWNATITKDAIIQSWLGSGAVQELAEAGHRVIDTDYSYYYLDCGRGQWLDFQDGASFETYYPFNDWCQPAKNWRLIYSHDPRAGLSREAAKNVVGGEVAVWTETIDPVSVDSIMWPRAAAAAEIWWSGRADSDGKNRTLVDARPRLSEQRERMLKRGVRGHVITQGWCDQHNVEDCTQPE
jgi:hexosaminidase